MGKGASIMASNSQGEAVAFRYFVGMGSNISPVLNFERAIHCLLALTSELIVSRVHETLPEGFSSNTSFLNAVTFFVTEQDERQLKMNLNEIEARLGRDRTDPDRGKKDRTIDLDVLLSLGEGANTILPRQVPTEAYYRPQMVELALCLGLQCRTKVQVVANCADIPYRGLRLGRSPMRISAETGITPIPGRL